MEMDEENIFVCGSAFDREGGREERHPTEANDARRESGDRRGRGELLLIRC